MENTRRKRPPETTMHGASKSQRLKQQGRAYMGLLPVFWVYIIAISLVCGTPGCENVWGSVCHVCSWHSFSPVGLPCSTSIWQLFHFIFYLRKIQYTVLLSYKSYIFKSLVWILQILICKQNFNKYCKIEWYFQL